LWRVDASSATPVVEAGTPVTEDGAVVGKLGTFDVARADSHGNVLLRGSIDQPINPSYAQKVCLLLWNPKDGIRIVGMTGRKVPELGSGWSVQALRSCSMDADGHVAITCKVGNGKESKEPVILVWSNGRQTLVEAQMESRKSQKKVEIPAKGRRPAGSFMTPVVLQSYRLGAGTIEMEVGEETLNPNATAWLPGGRFGVFAGRRTEIDGKSATIDEMYAIDLATMKTSKFETGGPGKTWFGSDGNVALIDTWWSRDWYKPTALRAGPPAESIAKLADFPVKQGLGIPAGQTMSGSDESEIPLLAALGPNAAFAFTGFVAGPPTGRAGRWILFTGQLGGKNDRFAPLMTEAMPSPYLTLTDRRSAGRFAQLQYADDGTLLIATDGWLAPIDSSSHKPSEIVGYVWACDPQGHLRMIAGAGDGVAVPPGSAGLIGAFRCKLCTDGRVMITRAANDCVFLANLPKK
jgi:hypothetical protein